MKVKISRAVLSFPALFKPRAYEGQEPSYSAVFIIPKEHEAVGMVKTAMLAAARERWADKADAILKSLIAGGKVPLKDGDTKAEYEGFAGKLFLSARSKRAPRVVDQARMPMVDDGRLYAGCIVNGVVDIWAMDNNYGKRICATLLGVQLVAEGEPLGGGTVASDDDFEVLTPGEDVPF